MSLCIKLSSASASSIKESGKESKINNTSKLLIDYKKCITIISSLSKEANIKCLVASDVFNKCQNFLEMTQENQQTQLPNEEMCTKFLSYQNELKTLMDTSLQSDNFF